MPARKTDRLADRELQQINAKVPDALNERLDVLVERAEDAGERTIRREVLAALILAAPASGDQLGHLIREFRSATVADAMVAGVPPERFVRPPRKERRGPRSREGRNR